MSILVPCSCGKRLNVADHHAGKKVRCPACANVLSVPAASSITKPAPRNDETLAEMPSPITRSRQSNEEATVSLTGGPPVPDAPAGIPPRYRSSGRLGVRAPLLVLTTLLASVICGVVYTYIHFYISVVYVKVPAAILTPVFAGFAVLLAAFGCRCRSRVFVILMGGLAGLLTLYFSWVTYASLIAGDHAFSGRWAALAASPQELFRKIEVISHQPLLKGEIGSAFTTETSPWERMTYWIAEALALVVGAIVMVYFTFGDIVYCEKCAAWCQAGSPPAYFDAREASQAARAGDLRALVAGPASSRKVPPCLQLVFHICPRCKTWIAYRVVEIKPGKQGQGSNVENLRATSGNLLLNNESRRWIEGFLGPEEKARLEGTRPPSA